LTPPQEISLFANCYDFTGTSVLAEDVDGDDDVDLVSINHFRNLGVTKGNGDGTFASSVGYPGAYSRSISIASGDFDNDGDVDVVGTSGSSLLYVYLNDGNGSFALPAIIDAPSGRTLETPAVADVNEDGSPDVVVATQRRTGRDTPGVAVYLNNGDGSFRFEDRGVGFPASADSITWPEAIRSADFDDDGAPDIAIADSTTGNVLVFFNETVAYDLDGDWMPSDLDLFVFSRQWEQTTAPGNVLLGDFDENLRCNAYDLWLLLSEFR
jgi:hypothetical protein